LIINSEWEIKKFLYYSCYGWEYRDNLRIIVEEIFWVEGICLCYVETDGLLSTKRRLLFIVYGSCWNNTLKMVFGSKVVLSLNWLLFFVFF